MLLAAFVGVVGVGVLEGIGIAVLVSLGNFVRKAWWPHSTELGRVAGVPGLHDIERHPDAELVDGLLLLRFDAPLFFANAAGFGRTLQAAIDGAGRPIRRVVVVANAVTDIDTTGAEILGHVLTDLERRNMDLWFAGLKGPVKDRLRDYGVYDRLGDDRFFPNTLAAVAAHEARPNPHASG
jgi:MFS superfamily sulfate permease-like transporter